MASEITSEPFTKVLSVTHFSLIAQICFSHLSFITRWFLSSSQCFREKKNQSSLKYQDPRFCLYQIFYISKISGKIFHGIKWLSIYFFFNHQVKIKLNHERLCVFLAFSFLPWRSSNFPVLLWQPADFFKGSEPKIHYFRQRSSKRSQIFLPALQGSLC